MKKHKDFILYMIGCLIVISYCLIWLNWHQILEHKVVGNTHQLWEHTIGNSNNPFEEQRIRYAHPLKVKDGYVLYETWTSDRKYDDAYQNSTSLNNFTKMYDFGEYFGVIK